MDIAKAKSTLKQPLKFGNAEQIQAHRYLIRIETLIDLIKKHRIEKIACSSCDGLGQCQCLCGHEHECGVCDGNGTRGGTDKQKEIVNEYAGDELRDGLTEIRNRRNQQPKTTAETQTAMESVA